MNQKITKKEQRREIIQELYERLLRTKSPDHEEAEVQPTPSVVLHEDAVSTATILKEANSVRELTVISRENDVAGDISKIPSIEVTTSDNNAAGDNTKPPSIEVTTTTN